MSIVVVVWFVGDGVFVVVWFVGDGVFVVVWGLASVVMGEQ